MRRADARLAGGFTLVEMIVTLVVLAIVAGMAAVFIRAPAAGYRDAVNRAEMTDVADTVLRRMSREVRLALPNSVRVLNGNTIEMLLTRTGGRYLAAEDGIDTAPILDFLEDGLTFTVVGDMPAGKQAIVEGDRVVVFNLGSDFAPADAYSGGNSAEVDSVLGNEVTLKSNPFALQDPPMPSPASRFHVVREAVRYTCVADAAGKVQLKRHSGYVINQDITADMVGGVSALAANNVTGCAFSIVTLGTTRSSLVIFSITLATPGSEDGPLTLTHQVHVDNTP